MIVGIQGTRNFSDYQILMRAMGSALYSLPEDDKEFFIYSAGPANINSMATEFSNITERSLKAIGIKSKLFRVPPSNIKEKIQEIDYFIFLSKPGEATSDLVDVAESASVEVGIYRY